MSSKNKNKSDNLPDFLFDYFMNEDKIDDQLRAELGEEAAKKLENFQPKLDSHISDNKKSVSARKNVDLPSVSSASSNNSDKSDVEFNDSDVATESYKSDQSSDSNGSNNSDKSSNVSSVSSSKSRTTFKKRVDQNMAVPLGDKIIKNIEKYQETPEEKRARARDAYTKLEELRDRGVEMSRSFSIDDDPDEMEAEYTRLKEKRNKANNIKMYKNILINIIWGAEYFNENYNPFEFKLKDWSKQVAADSDEYTEVLEELYEKYRGKSGKMSPELKLILMLGMSGFTYHISQKLIGTGGISSTIGNNPNVIGKLLGGVLGGKNDSNDNVQQSGPNNNKILDKIRSIRKGGGQKNIITDDYNDNDNDDVSTKTSPKFRKEMNILPNKSDYDRNLIEEMNKKHENDIRKITESYNNQVDDLRRRLSKIKPNNNYESNVYSSPMSNKSTNSDVNIVLSDANTKPRFMTNNYINTPNNFDDDKGFDNLEVESSNNLGTLSDTLYDMFASDKNTEKNKNVKEYYDIIDSLNEGTDDLDKLLKSDKIKSIKKSDNIKSIKKTDNNKFGKQNILNSTKYNPRKSVTRNPTMSLTKNPTNSVSKNPTRSVSRGPVLKI